MSDTSFAPRWASSPAETIREALMELGLSVEDLADQGGLSDADARELVTGQRVITPEIAEVLVGVIGSTTGFWLNREARYQESLNLVTADDLVQQLPKAYMENLGWRNTEDDWRESAYAFLDFFDLRVARDWNGLYGTARFRESPTFASNQLAVAAWLRQGEIEAKSIQVGHWSPEAFGHAIVAARALTKIKDPRDFVPRLQGLFAQAGVALVVVKTPEGCAVSGAALEDRDGTKLIVVSARFLADDHFWFTVFHEAGHILRHDVSQGFLDDLDDTSNAGAVEMEADSFARDLLIKGDLSDLEQLGAALTYRRVAAWAAAEGIAPGVLVGRLQHDGVLAHSQLNKLKRRYKWDGLTLTLR